MINGLTLGVVLGLAQVLQPPPGSIDERITACVAAEDAEPARAIALAESVLEQTGTLSPLQRAEALGCRGWSNNVLGQREPARRDAHALVDLVQSFPASADRVRLTRRAGGILHRGGDRVGAVELYARALNDAELQALEAERIPLLVNLGVLHSEFEEHERARVNYEQALSLMDKLGDHRFEAPVRFNLGLTLSGQDKYAEAVPHLQRALELVRSSGMGGPMQEAAIGMGLTYALHFSGDTAGSEAMLAQVKALNVQWTDLNQRVPLLLVEAGQMARNGDAQGALEHLDTVAVNELGEMQRWHWLRQRVALLEQLGRLPEALAGQHQINQLRDTYLRHQNHERLAALEAHLRDREQRTEMERLQTVAAAQSQQLRTSRRLTWTIAIAAGLLLALIGIVVAAQRRMNKRLDQLGRTDSLTVLANRRDMTERLGRHTASGNAGAVLLFDIDLFKRINDDHGHGVGDEVLVGVASRLRESLPEAGAVARWGGEEFLVLLDEASLDNTMALLARVRMLMRLPITTSVGELRVTLSAGFCNLPLPGVHGNKAWHCSMQLADSALYLAKRAQRDTWVGYWVDTVQAEWPAERLGREPNLARSLGVLVPLSERPLTPPLSRAS